MDTDEQSVNGMPRFPAAPCGIYPDPPKGAGQGSPESHLSGVKPAALQPREPMETGAASDGTFAYRIKGEEWVMQGIFDGDIAIVNRVLSARSHDLVLWHDGQDFSLSRPAGIPDNAVLHGTVTAIVRHFR